VDLIHVISEASLWSMDHAKVALLINNWVVQDHVFQQDVQLLMTQSFREMVQSENVHPTKWQVKTADHVFLEQNQHHQHVVERKFHWSVLHLLIDFWVRQLSKMISLLELDAKFHGQVQDLTMITTSLLESMM
jgi:hypothetical protein